MLWRVKPRCPPRRLRSPLTILALLLALAAGGPGGAVAEPRGGAAWEPLRLVVTTNTRSLPQVREGQVLMRAYRLDNLDDYPLRRLRISDPQLASEPVNCPAGDVIAALGEVTCTGLLRAGAVGRFGRVTATAQAPRPYAPARAQAWAGFQVRTAALMLTRTVERSGPAVLLRYVVSTQGNVPVVGVRLTDPLLAAAPLVCTGGAAPPTWLAAVTSLACSAQVPARAGTHRAQARVDGFVDDGAVAPDGHVLTPISLTATADGGYVFSPTGAGSPPPPPSSSVRHPGPHGTAAAAGTGTGRSDRSQVGGSQDRRPGAGGGAARPAFGAEVLRTDPSALPKRPSRNDSAVAAREAQARAGSASALGEPLGPGALDWALVALVMSLFPALLVAVGGAEAKDRKKRP